VPWAPERNHLHQAQPALHEHPRQTCRRVIAEAQQQAFLLKTGLMNVLGSPVVALERANGKELQQQGLALAQGYTLAEQCKASSSLRIQNQGFGEDSRPVKDLFVVVQSQATSEDLKRIMPEQTKQQGRLQLKLDLLL